MPRCGVQAQSLSIAAMRQLPWGLTRLLISLADMRLLRFSRAGGASTLGPLESRVMNVLWKADTPISVAQVHRGLGKRLPILSYSAIKAVLNNLASKGHVKKRSAGRSNLFTAALSQEDFERQLVSGVLDALIRSYREPVLAHLIDEFASDDETLDQLERLISERRRSEGQS